MSGSADHDDCVEIRECLLGSDVDSGGYGAVVYCGYERTDQGFHEVVEDERTDQQGDSEFVNGMLEMCEVILCFN